MFTYPTRSQQSSDRNPVESSKSFTGCYQFDYGMSFHSNNIGVEGHIKGLIIENWSLLKIGLAVYHCKLVKTMYGFYFSLSGMLCLLLDQIAGHISVQL